MPDEGRPGLHIGRGKRGRKAFERRGGQFGEQRDRAQQRDLHDRDGRMGVQAEQSAPAGAGGERQHGGDAEQREPAAPKVDEHRHQHCADREPGHGEPFEKAEHLSQ